MVNSNNKQLGKLIVFEGVDASGKTTLSNELYNFLQLENKPVRQCFFPGKQKGTLGELVYRIHHYHSSEFGIKTLDPCALQMLHIAAHVDVIESKIKLAILEGAWIILDRFWWSTYVYGLDSGVQEAQLRDMINVEKGAWNGVKPEVIFLINSASPMRQDESNSVAWHRKKQLYQMLANSEKDNQICIQINTKIGNHNKKNALSVIKSSIEHLM